jgi:hypothetical protein
MELDRCRRRNQVSDPVKEKQIREYEREEHQAVLYLPGLTGFLIEDNPRFSHEARLTGRTLRTALNRAGRLPPLIERYLAASKPRPRALTPMSQPAVGLART